MPRQIVIIGAGFAGVWSALSAQRLINLSNQADQLKVLVIAPEPHLVLRPRLYEANAAGMTHALGALFQSAGIGFLQGKVDTIDTKAHTVHAQSTAGDGSDPRLSVSYDRLIMAAGSSVKHPRGVAGLGQFAFDVDSLESAARLEQHLKGLASLPESDARDTIVVCGAGFTGIELAAELPGRLVGHVAHPRVVLVESASQPGSGLGAGPRPVVAQALEALGVEVRAGAAVASIDADGLTLASGERIRTRTAIWTAGVVATCLTDQVCGPKDRFLRLHVDRNLRALSAGHVFVSGDAAFALADREGHHALMSCQHALQLGRVSGHNAAADLLGEPMVEYSQAAYICCLDLGSQGAVISRGWGREVKLTGDSAKRVKGYINRRLIYPPDTALEALELANPIGPDSDELLEHILEVLG